MKADLFWPVLCVLTIVVVFMTAPARPQWSRDLKPMVQQPRESFEGYISNKLVYDHSISLCAKGRKPVYCSRYAPRQNTSN
jgi:hypothetical protein